MYECSGEFNVWGEIECATNCYRVRGDALRDRGRTARFSQSNLPQPEHYNITRNSLIPLSFVLFSVGTIGGYCSEQYPKSASYFNLNYVFLKNIILFLKNTQFF
jgi:hypothetical protein